MKMLKMTMKQAKEIANDAFRVYCGFNDAVLPDDIAFSCAGNIRSNGWTQADLFAFFAKLYKR
jgi:hypothetical protein